MLGGQARLIHPVLTGHQHTSPSSFSSLILPLSLLLSSPMSGICTGSSKDNDDCDCQQFVPKKSKQTRCRTCGHRRITHSDTDAPPTSSDAAKPAVNYGGRVLESYGTSAAVVTARKEMLSGYRTPSNKVCATALYLLRTLMHHSPTSPQRGRKSIPDARHPESPPRTRTPVWERLVELCFSPVGTRYSTVLFDVCDS
jgi:hypothetical protein